MDGLFSRDALQEGEQEEEEDIDHGGRWSIHGRNVLRSSDNGSSGSSRASFNGSSSLHSSFEGQQKRHTLHTAGSVVLPRGGSSNGTGASSGGGLLLQALKTMSSIRLHQSMVLQSAEHGADGGSSGSWLLEHAMLANVTIICLCCGVDVACGR